MDQELVESTGWAEVQDDQQQSSAGVGEGGEPLIGEPVNGRKRNARIPVWKMRIYRLIYRF